MAVHLARTALYLALATCVSYRPLLSQDRTEPYAIAGTGTRILESGTGVVIKVLVERTNLGGSEVEVAEITIPAAVGDPPREHTHGRVEVLYILEGELDHVVNGQTRRLGAGAVGMVRPGDRVVHRVRSSQPVRAVVIWAPGGEITRLAPFLRERPVP